jgi:hypothetical protein
MTVRRGRRGVALGLAFGLLCTAAGVTSAPVGPGASGSAPAAAGEPIRCPPPVDVRESAPGSDRGLLWRLTRDGRVSYLFGTVHVGRPGWRRFGPRTAAALNETRTLALELDPGDPALREALSVHPPAPVLPPALQQRLQRAIEQACLPMTTFAALHPVLLVGTLALLEARWLGLDPAFSMEMLLAERARSAGRPIVSLESAELQQAALVPADASEATALIERSLEQIENRSGRRVLERLVRAWEQGDLATLQDYERWCECATTADERAFMRRLNDERNPHLAERIAALHAQGQSVFAAVGALHMTGPQSLPALLAARGFRVERIAFVP